MESEGKLLDDLKVQVARIMSDEPCSPAEIKMANALCVLISIVKQENAEATSAIRELSERTAGLARYGAP